MGLIIQQNVENPVWDDLRFGFTQARQGALLKPDFDTTNVGLLFPQNDATEKIYLIGQLPHTYKEGTDIEPHLHWQQSNATFPTWKFDYKWFNVGDLVPAGFTISSANSGLIAYSAGNLNQYTDFAAITGTGKKISSVLLMKFYRDDNDLAGDALGFEFDIHFRINSLGSNKETTKE